MALYRPGQHKADELGLIGEIMRAPTAIVRSLARHGPLGQAAAVLISGAMLALFASIIVYAGPFGPGPVWIPALFAAGVLGIVPAFVAFFASLTMLVSGTPRVDETAEKEAFLRHVETLTRPVHLCTECRIVLPDDAGTCPRCNQRSNRYTVDSKRDLNLLRALLLPTKEE